MYPNPVNNISKSSIHALQEEDFQVRFDQRSWQIVYSKSLSYQQSIQTIDCSNIPSGYIVWIELANKNPWHRWQSDHNALIYNQNPAGTSIRMPFTTL